MKKIFVFGSINMDLSIECSRMPSKGETLRGFGFIESPGGKGANQAAAAAKTGAQVYMVGKVGADRMGDSVAASLESYGVHCECLLRDGTNTGVAVIIRSEDDNRIICDYGANYEITCAEAARVLDNNASAGDIFMAQLECRHEDVFAGLMDAKKRGLVTVFNPAPAAKLPEELYKSLDYIIVNQTECELLTGIYPKTFDDTHSALNQFRERGVACPIVTLGALGSISYCGNDYTIYPALSVKIVDTTAAGDAYIGAFSSRLAAGDTVDNALKFATAAAAVTITRLGAQQAVPYTKEVEEFIKGM